MKHHRATGKGTVEPGNGRIGRTDSVVECCVSSIGECHGVLLLVGLPRYWYSDGRVLVSSYDQDQQSGSDGLVQHFCISNTY